MKQNLKLLTMIFAIGSLTFFMSCGGSDDGIKVPSNIEIDFDAATASVAENGNPVSVTLSFVELPSAITVTAAVTGTAVSGTDFTSVPAVTNGNVSLSIPAGESSTTIEFTPIDNNLAEGSKTVVLTLQAAEGIELGTNATFTLTITDDEDPGEALPYTEDFNGCDTGLPTGWTFINVTAAIETWECTSDTRGISGQAGDYAVEINGYDPDGPAAAESWMISPLLNLGSTATKVSFYSLVRFMDDSQDIELKISSDYDGGNDPSTATWTTLTAGWDMDGSDFDYTFSGEIDLSAYLGVHYLAFHYTADGLTDAEQRRIDQFVVSEGSPATLTVTESITDFGEVDNGSSSSEQTFTVQGTDIDGDVTIEASSNFEVSLTSWEMARGAASQSVTLSDVTSAQTVYVRFSPVTGVNQVVDGTISISAANVAAQSIEVSGTESGNASTLGLLEEQFDYGSTSGNFVDNGNGFGTANWYAFSGQGSNPASYLTTSLSMSGYSGSGVGGSIQLQDASGSIEDIARDFASQTSGSVYFGMLLNIAPSARSSEFGDYFASFRSGSGSYATRLTIRDSDWNVRGTTATYDIGIREGGSGDTSFSATALSYDVTYFVVIKYDLDSGVASIYISDTMMNTEPGSAAASAAEGTDYTDLASIAFRGDSDNPAITIDGVIVTTDWNDFVSQ